MADNTTYVSKSNLDVFTRALRTRLDLRYAKINHTHSINDLSFNAGIDFLDYRMLPKASTDLPGVVTIGEGPDSVAKGNHTHLNASSVRDGFMSKDDWTKLESLYNYEHPVGDGYSHIPATGEVSDGMVLTAGNKPNTFKWQTLPLVTDANDGIMASTFFVELNTHLGDSNSKHKTPTDNKVIASVGDALQLETDAKQVVPAINELNGLVNTNTADIVNIKANLSGLAGTLTALTAAAFNRMNPVSYQEGTICYVLDTTGLVVGDKEYDGSPTSFIVVDPDGPGLKEKQWVELSAMTPKMEAGAISYYSAGMPSATTVEEALNILNANKLNRNNLVANKIVTVGSDANAANPLRCSNIDASVLDYLDGLGENVQTALDNKASLRHTHVCADVTDLAAMTDTDITAVIEAAFK